VEIYEGNIVLYNNAKRKIIYCEGAAGYMSIRLENGLWPIRLAEIAKKSIIIGNIFDNPDFLEKGAAE
jgi:hypothetical protein